MHTVVVSNVNEALVLGVNILKNYGVLIPSRVGTTIECPMPLTTCYNNPCERVLFDPDRRANPFFHLFESLWMLAGRNDLAFLTQFNKRMAEYSDDGQTVNGSAYGYRWKKWFEHDQLELVIDELCRNPNSRRCYLANWDGGIDPVDTASKDVPCNVGISFRVRDGHLTMTVFNRSNDIIWGAYGANAVHFSMLQEYIAFHCDLKVGQYWQVSNSFHAYVDNPQWAKLSSRQLSHPGLWDEYRRDARHVPLDGTFDAQLEWFFKQWDAKEPINPSPYSGYFGEVVIPMWEAWRTRDLKPLEGSNIDWHMAGRMYLAKRDV